MHRRHMAKNSGVHDLARIFVGPVWLPDSCTWQRPGLPALCQFSSPFRGCQLLDFRV